MNLSIILKAKSLSIKDLSPIHFFQKGNFNIG